MSLLLLGLALSLANAQPSIQNSCVGRGSCQRHPGVGDPPPSDSAAGEDRVLGSLLCHLHCMDSAGDLVRLRL